jgi:NTE family protein
LLGGVELETLTIPLTIVAADIAAGKEVWISSGDLLEAVRPDNSAVTVAVSLSGREVSHPYGDRPPAGIENTDKPGPGNRGLAENEKSENAGVDGFLDSLQRFFGRDVKNGHTVERSPAKLQEKMRRNGLQRPALTDVMLGMFNTMQDTLARHQLASNPPDILIDIPCNICEFHEFHKANELISAGEYWARRALAEQRSDRLLQGE